MSAEEAVVGPVRKGVESWDVEECLAVYVPHTARALTLNRTAADVYLLSTGEFSVDEVVRLLASSYGVAPETIRADVLSAVEMLRQEDVYG